MKKKKQREIMQTEYGMVAEVELTSISKIENTMQEGEVMKSYLTAGYRRSPHQI